MIERILLIFWGVWLLLLFVAACRVFGFLIARRLQDRRWGDGSKNQQAVALIVPVKGFEMQSTPRFFDSIFGQNYREYRVIVCFESWSDPVVQWLQEHLEAGPGNPVWTHPEPESGLRSVTLVCAGISVNEGQKVHNQIAAFGDLTEEDAVIAFADADIVCGPDWLARLVAPVNQGTHPLSTTYRWLVPKRPTLPNQLASIINASITTQGGSELTNVLWGGSMAISREVFDQLNVPHLLSGSLNDDLRLSKAARRAGNKIAFVRSLILPTMVDFSWRGFFEFVRRQYTQVKFFSPILYTGTNLVLGFYVLGAVSILAALIYGYFFAWIPIAAAYVIDQFRALARQQVYLSLFKDDSVRQKLFASSWLEHMLTPFWMLLHWLLLASTWTQNRITWAGVRYGIVSKSETRVLHRAEAITSLPAGAPGLAMITAIHDRQFAAYTRPLEPAFLEVEEAITFTTVAEDAPEVALATPETVEAVEMESVATSAPLVRIVSPDPSRYFAISHPGAPSAVLPLTTTFYQRDLRFREPDLARDRGCLSAAEAALSKSRVIPPLFFPVRKSAPAIPSRQEAATGTTWDLPGFRTHPFSPVLSNVELQLAKTRIEGATFPEIPPTAPERFFGVILSRADALSTKTRVRTVPLFPVRNTPLIPQVITSPKPHPNSALQSVGGSPESNYHNLPATETFAWPSLRSIAARRTVPGAGNSDGSRSGPPVLSARVGRLGTTNGRGGHPRPVSRRPSGRR